MQFTIPQFIERETRIVGPLTMRQFVIIGIAGAFCFFLYFNIAKIHFLLFLLLSAIAMGLALALAFFQINGKSLPAVIANFIKFNLAPKIYLWRRRESSAMISLETGKRKIKKEVEEEVSLSVGKNGRLKRLQSEIETRSR